MTLDTRVTLNVGSVVGSGYDLDWAGTCGRSTWLPLYLIGLMTLMMIYIQLTLFCICHVSSYLYW